MTFFLTKQRRYVESKKDVKKKKKMKGLATLPTSFAPSVKSQNGHSRLVARSIVEAKRKLTNKTVKRVAWKY